MTTHVSAGVNRLLMTMALVVLAFSGISQRIDAQQYSTGVGGGTLNWTVTYNSSGKCGEYGVPYSYWVFSSFNFVYSGTTYPLGGSADYFNSPGISQG
ncbi:MAG: hypothetical protein WBP85_00215, partial [Terracidiphilus sp.]